ncbi:MAG TPA: hypothetical protein VG939_11710 [Caulobacteraceae bacterium]|nr:hypothetical protein [Caulobacteraceae bacterium]
MSPTDDARAIVDQLDALQASLLRAWTRASNVGDYDAARGFKAEADRAGEQLVDARQRLLDAIESGQDVSGLLTRMAGLAARIAAEQARVEARAATAAEIASVLDTVGQVIVAARQIEC